MFNTPPSSTNSSFSVLMGYKLGMPTQHFFKFFYLSYSTRSTCFGRNLNRSRQNIKYIQPSHKLERLFGGPCAMLVCWQSNPHLYPALRRKIAAALHQACHLKTHLGTRGRLRLQTRPTLVSRAAETSLQRQHLHRSCLQKKACMRRQEVKAESVSMGKCTAMETTTCVSYQVKLAEKVQSKK